MAGGAPRILEALLSAPGQTYLLRIVILHLPGRRQTCLVNRESGDLPDRKLALYPVAIEIVNARSRPAESFLRLNPMMLVEGENREFPERDRHAFHTERLYNEVTVNALDLIGRITPVRIHREIAERYALSFQSHSFVAVSGGCTHARAVSLILKFAGHLSRDHLDGTRAEDAERVSFVGNHRFDFRSGRVRKVGTHEYVCREVASATHDGPIVAAGTRVSIRARDALEERQITRHTDCGLGISSRVWTAGPINASERYPEQLATNVNQLRKRPLSRGKLIVLGKHVNSRRIPVRGLLTGGELRG